jgi:hypothetical protein
VLHTLTEEMSRQRIRELFVCYCVLLQAGQPLPGRHAGAAWREWASWRVRVVSLGSMLLYHSMLAGCEQVSAAI